MKIQDKHLDLIDSIKKSKVIPSKESIDYFFELLSAEEQPHDYFVRTMINLYRRIPIACKNNDSKGIRFYIKKQLAIYIIKYLKPIAIRDKKLLNSWKITVNDFINDFYIILLNEMDDYYSGSTYLFFKRKMYMHVMKTNYKTCNSVDGFFTSIEKAGSIDIFGYIPSTEDEVIERDNIKKMKYEIINLKHRFVKPKEISLINIIKNNYINNIKMSKGNIKKYKNSMGAAKFDLICQTIGFMIKMKIVELYLKDNCFEEINEYSHIYSRMSNVSSVISNFTTERG